MDDLFLITRVWFVIKEAMNQQQQHDKNLVPSSDLSSLLSSGRITSREIIRVLKQTSGTLSAEIYHPSERSASTGGLDIQTKDGAVVIYKSSYNFRSREGLPAATLLPWTVEVRDGVQAHFTKLGLIKDAPCLDVTERIAREGVAGAEVVIPLTSWDCAELLRYDAAAALENDLNSVLRGVSGCLKLKLSPDRKILQFPLTCRIDTSDYDREDYDALFGADERAAALQLWSTVKRNLARTGVHIDVEPVLKQFSGGGMGLVEEWLGAEIAVCSISGAGNLRNYLADEANRAPEREWRSLAIRRQPLFSGWLTQFDQRSVPGECTLETTAITPDSPLSVWKLTIPAKSGELADRIHRKLQELGVLVSLSSERRAGEVTLRIENPHHEALNKAFREFYRLG